MPTTFLPGIGVTLAQANDTNLRNERLQGPRNGQPFWDEGYMYSRLNG
jgi:hypothetical protein